MKQITEIKVSQTTADVLAFFLFLHEERELNFHPDTPFGQYVVFGTEQSKRCFNKKEAELLDSIMERCFEICEEEDKDIYLIAMDMWAFERFYKTHRVITDRKEINKFADEYIGDRPSKKVKALHVFGNDIFGEGYFICEKQDGLIYVEIENCYYEGTLRDMAIVVYDWMDKELPEGYLEACMSDQ